MTERNVRVHSQPSNRAIPASRDSKATYKSVLDTPYRVSWPKVPVDVQRSLLTKLISSLKGVAEHRTAVKRAGRKRKRESQHVVSSEKQEYVGRANYDIGLGSDAAHPQIILDHLTVGLNEVTKRLEIQAREARNSRIITTAESTVQSDRKPDLCLVFVCRADVDPPLLVDHLPHLIAACNTWQRRPLRLVTLPQGAEMTLSKAMTVRRATVIGMDDQFPDLESFQPFFASIPIIFANWLSTIRLTHDLIPTHVKQSHNVTSLHSLTTNMFIAIIGTRFSGKSCVEDYLVSCKGFTSVYLNGRTTETGERPVSASISDDTAHRHDTHENSSIRHLSFLSLSPLQSPAPTLTGTDTQLCFSTPTELLAYVTKRWQEDFVTSDLRTRDHIEMFVKRPFFLLVSVDAPLYERFIRSHKYYTSLEDFVREDDHLVFGRGSGLHTGAKVSSLYALRDLVDIQITNSFQTISQFESYLEELNLLDDDHLRPGWDAYFMTLASLASRRSNCMKRRVGAVLVRDNRVLATGYNGTPRGLLNCNEGGCLLCNSSITSTDTPNECVCLHAEENALLEAGRERVGQDAVLYCNTCPCLRCTVKIIQTGVKTVVYNLSYKVDDASASLFKQAGVELRRFNPSKKFNISVSDLSQAGRSALLIPGLELAN
ncbi:hypothetical protein AX17_000717 [Amanita inopinata Kibby_2008]|nr:hypothetical protein AX17_000717 [Amanita inopinata Kibby_2008]